MALRPAGRPSAASRWRSSEPAALGGRPQRRPLARQDRRHDQRRQHRQQLGVAHVACRNRWTRPSTISKRTSGQLEAARQADIERDQQDQLLLRHALEVGRLPFADHAERIAEIEDTQGDQDRFRAVGRDAGDQHGGNAELRQPTNRLLRSAASRAPTTASSAKAPHSRRPKVKPPCRLAHASMASSRSGRGARRSSTARTRPATQISMNGKASTCGRASKCGAVMTTGGHGEQNRGQRTDVAQQQAHQQREGKADRGGAQRRHGAPAAGIVGAAPAGPATATPWRSTAGPRR